VHSDFRNATRSLVSDIWALTAWLYLRGGIGRERASKVMKIMFKIVQQGIQIGRRFSTIPDGTIPVTNDARTAVSALSLDPVLQRTVCCPACFAPYLMENIPKNCPRRETPRSRPCGEPLLMERQTRSGPKQVPRRLYTTQSLHAWLEHFLMRPGIEDLLDQSYRRRTQDGYMRDIWESPAWCSLPGSFATTCGNLTFSYYIDWFNPLTNKIAGKKISAGAIMMFCLNLPPELRHRPENTFFAGITPLPKEPTVVTISAVQDPIVAELNLLWAGRMIRSHRNPTGSMRRVAILPFIGDTVALQKACGFASHGHNQFCWYCHLPRENIEDLKISSWHIRSSIEVRLGAEEWRTATTKVARKAVFDRTGNRHSSLLQLPYRDAVHHIVLGVMHNWLEGVLQHHFRRKWGIGVDSVLGATEDESNDDTVHNHGLTAAELLQSEFDWDNDDAMELDDDELTDLASDSQTYADIPTHPRHLRRHATSSLADIQDVPIEEEGDEDWLMADDESSDGEASEEEAPDIGTCIVDSVRINQIRSCIAELVLPTWIPRPPINLGEKTHGKLKAHTWFVLFTIPLPMVAAELWSTNADSTLHEHLLRENLFDVSECTNVVCSFKTCTVDADEFTSKYIRYRRGLASLFPNSPSVPNHHYAMHNGSLLKFWGPLMPVSEFPYEHHNGTLQKVKTNGHPRKLMSL
jgi:hypothetical protein